MTVEGIAMFLEEVDTARSLHERIATIGNDTGFAIPESSTVARIISEPRDDRSRHLAA